MIKEIAVRDDGLKMRDLRVIKVRVDETFNDSNIPPA
jgi:hypothetical protein